MSDFSSLPNEASPQLTDRVFTGRGAAAGAERKPTLTAIRALIIAGLTKSDVGLPSVDDTADSAKPVSIAQQAALDLKASAAGLSTHIADTANPHAVTKAQVGLGSADDTADSTKPVSTAQQAALDLKANIASPTLTGTPAAPTASPGTSTTQLATTEFSTTADAALLQSFNNRMFYYASAL